jgi:uncharacterized protein
MSTSASTVRSGLLMAGASASVVLSLWALHSVFAALVVYYGLFCIGVPLLELRIVKAQSGRALLQHLGVLGGQVRRGIVAGLALGAVLYVGMLVVFSKAGPLVFAGQHITSTLRAWGAPAGAAWLVILVMLLFNGVAEELFWRGYIHRRLEPLKRRWLALGGVALLFSSYHVYVLSQLLPSRWALSLLTALIFCAALLWGALRERFGCVWPSLISHVCVTAGYLTLYWQFLR